ncbi:YkgJ family cysteine cluster protein [Acidovorax sp. BLS4]|uniref:YkgJ family cysteine cluster protein n=1 Tax=Acidovorax sp. BLS4 TaxID=3273430 RepID=UPI002942F929|nr:YkgJ family cysteine cluster protein [Paracidovorax avenae]WOI46267.1 YkgJ family cysteine cluster protein [Paracidovorax avenae]
MADAVVTVCRPGCGACCTAPSITSPIPGMPQGKPAGVRCIQLDDAQRCRIFGHPERPAVCGSLQPEPAMCGPDRAHALHYLGQLEAVTRPAPRPSAAPAASS